jgi:hypothetical protein
MPLTGFPFFWPCKGDYMYIKNWSAYQAILLYFSFHTSITDILYIYMYITLGIKAAAAFAAACR